VCQAGHITSQTRFRDGHDVGTHLPPSYPLLFPIRPVTAEPSTLLRALIAYLDAYALDDVKKPNLKRKLPLELSECVPYYEHTVSKTRAEESTRKTAAIGRSSD
jgi:hypothetical protein